MRLACRRHLADLKAVRHQGFTFDEVRANHAIDFFERFLRLPDTTGPDGSPRPFMLQAWQAFIIGNLFGWIWSATGYRRYRNAYVEVGKGSGKTPMAAGVGLYMLLMDGERAAEIYAAAVTRDQAKILFRDAERMVECSPGIAAKVQRTVNNIAYGQTLSFFRPLSSEHKGLDGIRPHCGLIDELHEHPEPMVANKVRAGAKHRPQPLFLEITNAGYDRTSICWQHHEHSRRVLEGTEVDDRWFAYVCALDDEDDPIEDPRCWVKANPNLGISIQETYLRDQVSAAKSIPAETNTVLRLNFCVWTQSVSRFFDMPKWHACDATVAEADLIGAACYAGLDLGQSDDFCAFVQLWLLEDGRKAVKARFWIPQKALELKPNRPYAEWLRAGLLEVTEGDISDYDVVEAAVAADCLASGVRECAYDKRFAQQMALHLEGQGITMVDMPQGFQLNEALRWLSDAVVNGELCHGGHPILGWMAANVVVRHGRQGEVRPDKEKASEKIDGIVALAMAVARAVVSDGSESKYEREGLVTL